MSDWKINRQWRVHVRTQEPQLQSTESLAAYPAVILLGAAGIGKSFELNRLMEADRSAGLEVRSERIVTIARTNDALEAGLRKLVEGATATTAIHLDGLDEAMLSNRQLQLSLEHFISDSLARTQARLRIACRSGVWPNYLRGIMDRCIRPIDGEPDQDCTPQAVLQPLTDEDLITIAEREGVASPANFLAACQARNITLLAQQPIVLKLLLRLNKSHGGLPISRSAILDQGMRALMTDSEDRRDLGLTDRFLPRMLLEAAGRLACFMLLSGHDEFSLRDTEDDRCFGWPALEALPPDTNPLGRDLLVALGDTALFERRGDGHFGFAHRQFAEHLAGKTLSKLPPHQSKALLCTRLGWRFGVAGPLRETAAAAASSNSALADWLAECDPEVVGLSEVASDDVRRTATLTLLGKFRRHEFTDASVRRDGVQLEGLRFKGAEAELGPILLERGKGLEDLHECAVELALLWELHELSDELAAMALDPEVSLHVRRSASMAILKMGTAESKRRLMPLADGSSTDSDDDLKGIALSCNWPEHLSSRELLPLLTNSKRSTYFGSYGYFLIELDESGFNASDCILDGLDWAFDCIKRRLGHGYDHDRILRLAKRIAHESLTSVGNPAVAHSLARLLLEASARHVGSPLAAPKNLRLIDPGEPCESDPEAPLVGRQIERRILLTAIVRVTHEEKYEHGLWATRETPGLLVLEDFRWLLTQAVDAKYSAVEQRGFAFLASMLQWTSDADCYEAWFAVRSIEPVASVMKYASFIEIPSPEEENARKYHRIMHGERKPTPIKKLTPCAAQRVQDYLQLCQEKDPNFFFQLCRELTLTDESQYYGVGLDIHATPGWEAADAETRSRIVDAAVRFMETPTTIPEDCRSEPMNSVLEGHVAAIKLLEVERPDWVANLNPDWWDRWGWYLLRELRPDMHGEAKEPKLRLLGLLAQHAPGRIRTELLRLASLSGDETKHLCRTILDFAVSYRDVQLDTELLSLEKSNGIALDRLRYFTEFLLVRGKSAMRDLIAILDPNAAGDADSRTSIIASTLLSCKTVESWGTVMGLISGNAPLAARVLADFCRKGRRMRSEDDDFSSAGLKGLTPRQIGAFVGLLLRLFPPETDPVHEGVYSPSADEPAREARDRLISYLGDSQSQDAVEALRALEREFGEKYSWIRRPRARAERALLRSLWNPIPPETVAALLVDADKKLIRSPADAVDGIVHALDAFNRDLRRAGTHRLEHLWNTGDAVSPKAEEHISAELADVIKVYFGRYGVAIDREVQLYRGPLPASAGGPPGDLVDILLTAPDRATATGNAIIIPIEVKLSNNAEVKTALSEQLVKRYMPHADSDEGLFVLLFMNAPGLKRSHRPRWPSVSAATTELETQAKAIEESSGGGRRISVVVIDASLPSAAPGQTTTKVRKKKLASIKRKTGKRKRG